MGLKFKHWVEIMRFTKPEYFVIKIIFTSVTAVILLAYIKGIEIEYANSMFKITAAIVIFLLALGQFYRRVRINEPIAVLATVSALLLMMFHSAMALNYMYLPYAYFGFDQQLANIDASIGYVWSDFVTYAADYKFLTDALRVVYTSSFEQILLAILILGLASKIHDLYVFLITLTLSLLICISVWSLFPSSSTVTFQPLAEDVAKQLDLIVNATLGEELVRLSVEGINTYPPKKLEGLIGFPSFHTVMLVLTVYAVRNVKVAFFPALLWNLAMFPALLIHGAHNLVDMFAGLAVAAFSIYCAKKIVFAEDFLKQNTSAIHISNPVRQTTASGIFDQKPE
jgi:hypothetical protein